MVACLLGTRSFSSYIRVRYIRTRVCTLHTHACVHKISLDLTGYRYNIYIFTLIYIICVVVVDVVNRRIAIKRKNGSASVIVVNIRSTTGNNKIRVLYATTNTFADGWLINSQNQLMRASVCELIYLDHSGVSLFFFLGHCSH